MTHMASYCYHSTFRPLSIDRPVPHIICIVWITMKETPYGKNNEYTTYVDPSTLMAESDSFMKFAESRTIIILYFIYLTNIICIL